LNLNPKPPDPLRKEKKSFASILCGGQDQSTIEFKTITQFKGEPALHFSDDDISKLSLPYSFVLIEQPWKLLERFF